MKFLKSEWVIFWSLSLSLFRWCNLMEISEGVAQVSAYTPGAPHVACSLVQSPSVWWWDSNVWALEGLDHSLSSECLYMFIISVTDSGLSCLLICLEANPELDFIHTFSLELFLSLCVEKKTSIISNYYYNQLLFLDIKF